MMPNQKKIEYLSQFNLLHSLSEEDLIEMDQLTGITTIRKNTFIQTPDSVLHDKSRGIFPAARVGVGRGARPPWL